MSSAFRTPTRIRLIDTAVSLLAFLLCLSPAEYLISAETKRLELEKRHQVTDHVTSVFSTLEMELNSNVFLATGLVAYIAAQKEFEPYNVEIALATLFRHGRYLRSIAVAPNNRIAYIYPLAGREALLGMNFGDMPVQWPTVKRAMDHHHTVLAGPVELLQGGIGLISRTPVFLDGDRYWGMLSLVLDSDALFRHVGLLDTADGIRYAVRGRDGSGSSGAVFLGDPGLFQQDAVLITVDVPDGTWQLAALPVGGWTVDPPHFAIFRFGGLAVSLVMFLLTHAHLTERARNKFLALHDGLTGLPNIRLLNDRMSQAVNGATRSRSGFAVLFLDLDGFKPINDCFGHKVGDRVLVELARRMAGCIRKSDTLARVGGDEFIVLLPDAGNREATMAVADKLRQTIGEALDMAGEARVTVSIGIAFFPTHGTGPDSLIHHADAAMYLAKQGGKNRIVVAPSPPDQPA